METIITHFSVELAPKRNPIYCRVCNTIILWDAISTGFKTKTFNGADLTVFIDKPSNMVAFVRCPKCSYEMFIQFKKKKSLTTKKEKSIIKPE